MPRQRPELIVGELYHVFNRSVENRVIFPTHQHYLRFIAALQFFNTSDPVTLRDFLQKTEKRNTWVGPMQSMRLKDKRLVQIGSFIIRPAHYHYFIRPLVENGLSLFMQKLGSGYAAFFNLKHSRAGSLFQGRYKVKLIDSDKYGRYIQAYIALNALDFIMPSWRENGIKNTSRALKLLKEYPWSSFSSYVGENRFPGIIDPEFIYEFFDTVKEFENFVVSWNDKDSEQIQEIVAG